jgi:hypothetical protein
LITYNVYYGTFFLLSFRIKSVARRCEDLRHTKYIVVLNPAGGHLSLDRLSGGLCRAAAQARAIGGHGNAIESGERG